VASTLSGLATLSLRYVMDARSLAVVVRMFLGAVSPLGPHLASATDRRRTRNPRRSRREALCAPFWQVANYDALRSRSYLADPQPTILPGRTRCPRRLH
jgi:hypothetical protein